MAHPLRRSAQKTTTASKKRKGPAARRFTKQVRSVKEQHRSIPNPEGSGKVKPAEIAVPPEILAPAGNMQSALAAFAAGADAVYLGLKHFSARMEAENFGLTDFFTLTELAKQENKKVYIAMNTLVKPGDIDALYRIIWRLSNTNNGAFAPDALIIQDIGILAIARDAGYTGELHISTLGNATHIQALVAAQQAGASRVILPRELSLAEIEHIAINRPPGLDLELFVHGALCYCVSGRCWWSSYMGGKSGLRGRCVQPCRRLYTQRGKEGRFFSSLDLSLDTDINPLLSIPGIRSWKIEGRKKTPHYVYHVVKAYKLLRDNPEAKKEIQELLALSLGRQNTKAAFIDGASKAPSIKGNSHTGSGLLVGRTTKREPSDPAQLLPTFSFTPNIPLLHKDLVRIGHEDEPWHALNTIGHAVKEHSDYILKLPQHKQPKHGTPVYLIDRKDPVVEKELAVWGKKLSTVQTQPEKLDVSKLIIPQYKQATGQAAQRKLNILVRSSMPQGRDAKEGIRPGTVQGLWISSKIVRQFSQTLFPRISWWLPPVVWPNEEESLLRTVSLAIRKGARHFVCNAPWQTTLFENTQKLALTAGPFCNTANAAAIAVLAEMGFANAIVSPELTEEEFCFLPKNSTLPLGIVLQGWWPMGISRYTSTPLKERYTFTSPKNEDFWYQKYGQNLWLYPGWPLNLSDRRAQLEHAGYTTFIELQEHPPSVLEEPKRTSEFNWSGLFL